MSQENVERLYRAYDAFNRRDLDAYLALIDPEVELTPRIMELEGGSYYRGHDGVREWWRTLFAVFPDFSTEILEVRDLGDSLIVSPARPRSRRRRRCADRGSVVADNQGT